MQHLDPVLGSAELFFLSRAPKRSPDFRPFFGVHMARFFLQRDVQKGYLQVGCLWVGHKRIAGTEEDLAQGVGFWYAFLASFWGLKTMVLSMREKLSGTRVALSFWHLFFLQL